MFKTTFLRTTGLVALSLFGIGGTASAAPQCVAFAGLEHCTVGSTTLTATSTQLEVKNPTQAIGGGVAIALPDATAWKGAVTASFGTVAAPVFQATALSEGAATSRSELRAVGDRAVFKTSFSGSAANRKYTVRLYRDGVLVGTVPNVPNDTPGGSAPVTILVAMAAGLDFVVAPTAECEWQYSFADQNITLPDGRVLIGDAIRFTEQVTPGGGYPYTTFDGLKLTGNFTRADLKNESITE